MSEGDTVFITGLAVHAFHGVMEHEAEVGQTFILDLELKVDLDEASRSDKLAHTVSYNDAVSLVAHTFRARRYRLVEAAGGAVAESLLAAFPHIVSVRITVHKPHAPIAATFTDVGVTLTRSRDG
jgi:dihydroneopterin aldolase